MKKRINKSISNFYFLLIFSLCVVSIATAQTPQQIAQKAFRSTVLLVMEDKNGQPLSLGSGFFVKQGQIATNLHVVESATRGYAKLVGKEKKFNIEGYTAIDEKRDLIILKVADFGTQTIPLGNSDLVQVGETVYAVGNPRGLEGTFSDGIISSIRPVGNDKLIQITAPLSPGSSGGPVLTRKGEVIGVSVLTIRSGQNLNFAIPSNYLKTLIAKIGYAKPLSQAKSNKGQRSILTGLDSDYSEAVTAGKLLWDESFGSWQFTFSMRNRLRKDVKNIHYYVIFYDEFDDPIDYLETWYTYSIPSGLAKRIRNKYSKPQVAKISAADSYLADSYLNSARRGLLSPDPNKLNVPSDVYQLTERVEFRILDFVIVE